MDIKSQFFYIQPPLGDPLGIRMLLTLGLFPTLRVLLAEEIKEQTCGNISRKLWQYLNE